MRPTMPEDFPNFVNKDTGTECWEWMGYVNPKGYGQFISLNKQHKAHRIAYEREYGSIPDGCDIHHLCENKKCVNPEHLEPLPRSAHLKGHKRTQSPLTHEQVAELRHLAATRLDLTLYDIAPMFGVSRDVAANIVTGRNWVDDGKPVVIVRKCQQCGDDIPLGRRRNARYCARACRDKAHVERQTARRRQISDELLTKGER